MHVVIALLGSIITVLYLLDRLGVDLGWLNPFDWRRRRKWAAKYQGDPIYSVEEPIHVAALLIVGATKLGGDLSSEQKQLVIDKFVTRFSMDTKEASELLASAAHLLGAPQVIGAQLEGLAERNKNCFSPEQAESMIKMMRDVAAADGEISQVQREFIEDMSNKFSSPGKDGSTWG